MLQFHTKYKQTFFLFILHLSFINGYIKLIDGFNCFITCDKLGFSL